MAGRMPPVGRLGLNPMLSPKGRIIGDFTVAQIAENRFQVPAGGFQLFRDFLFHRASFNTFQGFNVTLQQL